MPWLRADHWCHLVFAALTAITWAQGTPSAIRIRRLRHIVCERVSLQSLLGKPKVQPSSGWNSDVLGDIGRKRMTSCFKCVSILAVRAEGSARFHSRDVFFRD